MLTAATISGHPDRTLESLESLVVAPTPVYAFTRRILESVHQSRLNRVTPEQRA